MNNRFLRRKEYESSLLMKIFTLGLKRVGIKIISEELIIVGVLPKRIPIKNIKDISYDMIIERAALSYFYIITEENKKKHYLRFSLLEGITYQELFRDLLILNPDISLSYQVKEFVSSEIEKKKLKFDFNYNKAIFKDTLFTKRNHSPRKHISFDAFFTLLIIIIFSVIPYTVGTIGENILSEKFGDNYQAYRICAILTSGIATALVIINLLFSLVSMYLGHKFTIVSLIIAALGLCIGLL